MGYCYTRSGALCCDKCGNAGRVQKRTCPFKVKYAEGFSLSYCQPAALCPACYALLKHELHARCREGAAASTARQVERAARFAAGEYEVKAAWGSWHELLVPEGSTGVVFVNSTRGEEYRLVPADRYAPGERRYLSDYPEASPWCGPDARTKGSAAMSHTPMVVYVLSEHEPNHSEYPWVVLSIHASKESAEAMKRELEVAEYGPEDDPEGYDWQESEKWWEVEAAEVQP